MSYPAFVAELGGRRFLNLQDTEDSGRWYFANYLFHQGRLRLRLVDDELVGERTFPSAEELAASCRATSMTRACTADRRRRNGTGSRSDRSPAQSPASAVR